MLHDQVHQAATQAAQPQELRVFSAPRHGPKTSARSQSLLSGLKLLRSRAHCALLQLSLSLLGCRMLLLLLVLLVGEVAVAVDVAAAVVVVVVTVVVVAAQVVAVAVVVVVVVVIAEAATLVVHFDTRPYY
eukprot:4997333-Alexandrium_andersonii.AAC.1